MKLPNSKLTEGGVRLFFGFFLSSFAWMKKAIFLVISRTSWPSAVVSKSNSTASFEVLLPTNCLVEPPG